MVVRSLGGPTTGTPSMRPEWPTMAMRCRATNRPPEISKRGSSGSVPNRCTASVALRRTKRGACGLRAGLDDMVPTLSHVDIFGFGRPLHDEAEARARVLAHQLVHDAVGVERVLDHHPQAGALLRVERGGLEILRHHLAEPLEAADLGPRVLGRLLEQLIALLLVEHPEAL